jgi:hypothetical protein
LFYFIKKEIYYLLFYLIYYFKLRFKEASIVKKKIENIEKIDIEKFTKEKSEKVKAFSSKIYKQQLNEKNALKMKIEAELELMKKQRKLNFENLFNKYKNRKYELNMQQKQEKTLTVNNNLFKASIFFLYFYFFYFIFLIFFNFFP